MGSRATHFENRWQSALAAHLNSNENRGLYGTVRRSQVMSGLKAFPSDQNMVLEITIHQKRGGGAYL